MQLSENDRPVWTAQFSEEVRAAQLQEDSDAWYAVTGLLLTIICTGVALAVVTAWLCS
jgi:hypothetical protein